MIPRLDLIPESRRRALGEVRTQIEASARELGSGLEAVRRLGSPRAVAARLNFAHRGEGLRDESVWRRLLVVRRGRTPWTEKVEALQTITWTLGWLVYAFATGVGVWIWPSWRSWLDQPLWLGPSRWAGLFHRDLALLLGLTLAAPVIAGRLSLWISRREALSLGRWVMRLLLGTAVFSFAYFVVPAALRCRCFPVLSFVLSTIFIGGLAALMIFALRRSLRPLEG